VWPVSNESIEEKWPQSAVHTLLKRSAAAESGEVVATQIIVSRL
jgi:hypothetical protein